MDESSLLDATLDQLHQAKMLMTSPDWMAKIQAASPAQRQNAQAALLRLQQACTAMENADLADIADQLTANEPALTAGQDAVQSACNQVSSIQSVVKAVTSLVNVVAKIAPLV